MYAAIEKIVLSEVFEGLDLGLVPAAQREQTSEW
jgi:hypothetical protein